MKKQTLAEKLGELEREVNLAKAGADRARGRMRRLEEQLKAANALADARLRTIQKLDEALVSMRKRKGEGS